MWICLGVSGTWVRERQEARGLTFDRGGREGGRGFVRDGAGGRGGTGLVEEVANGLGMSAGRGHKSCCSEQHHITVAKRTHHRVAEGAEARVDLGAGRLERRHNEGRHRPCCE